MACTTFRTMTASRLSKAITSLYTALTRTDLEESTFATLTKKESEKWEPAQQGRTKMVEAGQCKM